MTNVSVNESALVNLYTEGTKSKGVAIAESDAKTIINSVGDFGNYGDAMAGSIVGLTKVEAYVYLMNLSTQLDANDGSDEDKVKDSDGYIDYDLIISLEEGKDIGSVFDFLGLGSDPTSVGEKLTTIKNEYFPFVIVIVYIKV